MSRETKTQIFNSLQDFNELLSAAHVEIITNQRLSFKKKLVSNHNSTKHIQILKKYMLSN